MRLLRLHLSNVRGIADRTVDLTRPDGSTTGVVVIEGDNEVGKSTLGDALDVLLTYKDSSKHAHVRSLQTTGIGEPPEVEAELQVGDSHLVYAKRYLKRTRTTLSISGAGADSLDGDAAHDRVGHLLAQAIDLQLWSSLRLRQADGLVQVSPGESAGLAGVLAEHGDVGAIGDRELGVLARAREEYERYATLKTGSEKPLLRDARAEVERLDGALAELDTRREALQSDVERADRLTRELPGLRDQARSARSAAEQLVRQQAAVDSLEQQLSARQHELREAEHELERLDQRRLRREQLRDELAELDTAATTEATQAAEVEADRDAALLRLDDARTAVDAAQERLRTARRRREQAQADLDQLRDRDQLDALQVRSDRAARALTALREARGRLAANPIDEATLDRLRAAHTETVRTRAALEVASPQVRIDPVRDLEVETDGRPERLTAGEERSWPVADALTLRLEEVGTIEVRAGAGSEDRREAHRRAQAQLQAELDQTGVEDLAAAEAAHRRRREDERAEQDAARDRERALEASSAEQLDGDIDRLARRLTEQTGRREAEQTGRREAALPLPDGIDAAQAALSAATAAERTAEEQVTDPEQTVESARAEVERHRAAVIGHRTREQAARERAGSRRAELGEELDALADDELTGRLHDLEASRQGSADAVSRAETELAAANPDTVRALLANAQQVAADAEQRRAEAEQQLRELRVRIAALGGDGLWEQREELDTDLEHARNRLVGLLRRAGAARRLHETLSRHRDLARERYAEPLRSQLITYGRMLHGPGFDLELDDDLRIARRHLDGLWLDLEQLSVGAREQLALLGRLACARLLGEKGGLLLFDDALGNTDPSRLERLGAVLREAGEHSQVVVLTCLPERYRHVGGARRIRL